MLLKIFSKPIENTICQIKPNPTLGCIFKLIGFDSDRKKGYNIRINTIIELLRLAATSSLLRWKCRL